MRELGYKERLLRILLILLEQPFRYKKKDLMNRFGVGRDAITNDFEAFKLMGWVLTYDEYYRYALKEAKPLKHLKDLLHFTEEDQILLMQAIDQISPNTKRGQNLKKKLGSLYDFKKLGLSYLRVPYLNKVDQLEHSIRLQKAVYLIDYLSTNSNQISDRKVEVFHLSPGEDMIQAYDLERKGIRHFRISRIKRVQITKDDWKNKGKHYIIDTDPFRIADKQRVQVHLRIKVGGKNELLERFPLTRAYILDTEREDEFDFQCEVNHKFLGLTNFILGNFNQIVEIASPDSLKQHLKEVIVSIKRQLY